MPSRLRRGERPRSQWSTHSALLPLSSFLGTREVRCPPLSPTPEWRHPSAGRLVGSGAGPAGSTCGRKLGSPLPRLGGHPRHLGAGVWAEPRGAGREAWAGGGADAERSSSRRGRGAERSRAGAAQAGRDEELMRVRRLVLRAFCEVLAGTRRLGASSRLLARPPRPGCPLCPLPAGRRRRRLDGTLGGFLGVESPS